jgi:hypothetical protein
MASDEHPGADPERADLMDLGMVTGSEDDRRADVIEMGGGEPRRSRGFGDRRWIKWLPAVLAVALVAAIVAHHQNSSTTAETHPTPNPSVIEGQIATVGPDDTPQPVVTQYFDHPFLGLYSTWELYGLGPTNVVRIQFARARLTRTEFPSLASSGPVSFVVDAGGAVVRPLDNVPGYRVPDTQAAKLLVNALNHNGPALPGPDGRSLWVPTGSGNHDQLMLVDDAGNKVGPVINIPDSMSSVALPDGAGYLILTDETGSYDARPDGLKRITSGGLLAVGTHQWLVDECDERHNCSRVVIDRGTGARHVLDHKAPEPTPVTGVISPDGHYAALVEFGASARYNVHVLDLTTGKDQSLDVPMDDDASGSPLAWSPDSQWLFAAGAAGELFPIHPRTGAVEMMDVPVPPLKQLVIRNQDSSQPGDS